MTDFDLDRLGDVWRQQLDPAEMERLQRSAAAVSRRARIAQFLDIVAGATVSAVVVFLVWTNPRFETFLMGAAAILVLLGSNIRLRKLRRVELRSLTGTTEDMLDQSIERLRTTLRHNRFTLMAMGPALIMGYLLASTAGPGGVNSLTRAMSDMTMLRVAWIGGTIAVVAAMLLVPIAAIRRQRSELERLTAMRETYRQERESSAP
jgi:hypothetical protein